MTESARRWPVVVLTVLSLMAAGGCSSGATLPPVDEGQRLPPDFVGLVSPETFVTTGAERQRLLREQAALGFGLLRQTFDWSAIEVRPGRYDLSVYDAYVADAAAAGLSLMPILFNPPTFHARRRHTVGGPTPPPSDLPAMARFARALVRRYGDAGSLWAEQPRIPRRPIRAWQVWNEPNLPAYWGGRPSAAEYGKLLRKVGAAIRDADPKAEVVTGGIPDSRLGIPFVTFVKDLVAAAGPRAFDALAIHPYARTPDAAVTAVAAARRLVSDSTGREVDLWITELGWASDGPRSQFTVGEPTQARFLKAALAELGRRADELGVRGVVYYNWKDAQPYAGGKDFWGLHTGLLRRDGSAKPAVEAFRQAVAELTKRP